VKGDATPVVPAAEEAAAAAATNKLGSMISVTDRRMVEFSQTLPELRTSSSLRQSLDNMVAFLDTSALDLQHTVTLAMIGEELHIARTLRANRASECQQLSVEWKYGAQDRSA
jgi:hypothetical protein